MESVAAGDGCDVDDAAGSATRLRPEVAGDDAKLLHGVDRYLLTYRGSKVVDVFDAVKKNARARRTQAVNVEASAADSSSAIGTRADVARDTDKVIRVAG